jgi:hypothetical protein
MHDPITVAFEIKSPFRSRPSKVWPEGYRNTLVTVWHCDPETDGSDDSCGWFMRCRHGDKAVLEKIVGDFVFQWTHGVPKGWFNEDGSPNYSSQAIVLMMFRTAANHHFGHWSRRANRFLRRHTFDILHFAENSCDSLHDDIVQHYGPRSGTVRDQAYRMAACVYSWVLRADRPWWKHPRWHVHHWRFQIHPLQALRRRLLSRCEVCGKGFGAGESVVGRCWSEPPRRWFESFRGERYVRHADCDRRSASPVANAAAEGK